jgi:FlaA1/EpsC-like NDP-sugar epimerase
VLLLYLVSFLLGVGAIAIRLSNTDGVILLVIGVALVVGIAQLRYREMAILRNGILLRFYLQLYDSRVLKRSAFQMLVDAGFALAACLLSYFLMNGIGGSSAPDGSFWPWLMVLPIAQVAAFWASGLYKGTVFQSGVGDAIRVAKSVILAAIVGTIGLIFLAGLDIGIIRAWAVLDFYFLISLILGSRFSFGALKYLFEKENTGEKRVLIYGADSYGVLILQNILGFDAQNLTPVGFLDDDPQLEGKYLSGYPIFGGHWQLHRLLERMSVNEVLLAQTVRPETLKRLKMVARSQGVTIRRFQIRLEDVTREVSRTQKDQAPVSVHLTS